MDAEHAQASPRGGAGGRALAAITLTVAALTLAACSSPGPSAPLPPGSSPAAAADAAVVTLPAAPAAAGTAGSGASDAYLSPATLAEHSHLVSIPLAVSALMVVYNVPGIGQATRLRLDGKLLARVYAGQITRWDDPAIAAVKPGVKLPGTGIVLVHRDDDSGSTVLLTSYLNAQDPSGWRGSLTGTTIAWPRQPGELSAAGADAVISGVKSAPGSIGYVGVSYLSQVRAAGEGEAALGNSAGGYVLPAPGAPSARRWPASPARRPARPSRSSTGQEPRPTPSSTTSTPS